MAVRNTVRDILKSNGKKIILNLADVNYIDSSGIGELVSTYTTVTNNGGQLKLLNLTKKIQELLAITKLLTVFQVYEDEQAALNSLK
jgi:anti-sigma B factor antagonist